MAATALLEEAVIRRKIKSSNGVLSISYPLMPLFGFLTPLFILLVLLYSELLDDYESHDYALN